MEKFFAYSLLVLLVSCDTIPIITKRDSSEVREQRKAFSKCFTGKGEMTLRFYVLRDPKSRTLFGKHYGYIDETYPVDLSQSGFEQFDEKCVMNNLRKIKFYMSNTIKRRESITQSLKF